VWWILQKRLLTKGYQEDNVGVRILFYISCTVQRENLCSQEPQSAETSYSQGSKKNLVIYLDEIHKAYKRIRGRVDASSAIERKLSVALEVGVLYIHCQCTILVAYMQYLFPTHQGYLFPSQVQNVAVPSSGRFLSSTAVTFPPSSLPPQPFSSMTFNMQRMLSCGVIIPLTSQSTVIFPISVLTSPGCNANTTGAFLSPPFPEAAYFLCSSADKCLKDWFSAAFEAL